MFITYQSVRSIVVAASDGIVIVVAIVAGGRCIVDVAAPFFDYIVKEADEGVLSSLSACHWCCSSIILPSSSSSSSSATTTMTKEDYQLIVVLPLCGVL